MQTTVYLLLNIVKHQKILNDIICMNENMCITLYRVFHGIRFILRLVKIACREISNFFMSAVRAGSMLAETVLIFIYL